MVRAVIPHEQISTESGAIQNVTLAGRHSRLPPSNGSGSSLRSVEVNGLKSRRSVVVTVVNVGLLVATGGPAFSEGAVQRGALSYFRRCPGLCLGDPGRQRVGVAGIGPSMTRFSELTHVYSTEVDY